MLVICSQNIFNFIVPIAWFEGLHKIIMCLLLYIVCGNFSNAGTLDIDKYDNLS